MKQVNAIILFCFLSTISFSQSFDLEDLKKRLSITINDTLRIVQLDSLAVGYSEINVDSSFLYSELKLELSKALGYKINEASALNMKAYALLNMGNYPASLLTFLNGIDIAIDPKSEKIIIPEKYRYTISKISPDRSPRAYRLQTLSFLYFNLGILYENAGNSEKALNNYFESMHLGELTNNKQVIAGACLNTGRVYLYIQKNDSALYFLNRSYNLYRSIGLYDYLGSTLLNLGRVYFALGKESLALGYLHEAVRTSSEQHYLRGVVAANLLLADISLKNKSKDSAWIFTQAALQTAKNMNAPDLILRSYNAVSNYYLSVKNSDSAVKYLSLVIRLKDSLFNNKQSRQFQNIEFEAQQRRHELEEAKKDFKDKVLKYMMIIGLAGALLITFILWRNNRHKQIANKLLSTQKQETEQQKIKVEKALEELKRTQAHLIQKEKMASLGELTAGIAHEIQNPLNFVNNFSELSNELLDEMNGELDKGDIEEVKAISSDIKQNLEKINHHGKRADAIVKGMLQHSRASSGQKEFTDINALCDDYLRLAYHGLKASDKSFNAFFHFEPDKALSKVNVVPQDIGRVLLNLINNAFYVVNEKTKMGIEGYQPAIIVSTKNNDAGIEVSVKDNGNGIPQKVLDKIFQPFFTTKPTGQGTGLGLSLSHDIVKAHGGEIRVETKEGEGSRFIILLPNT